ncbi:MAG: TOBE domain-containing protein [Woeseiales bacterium]
MNAQITNQAVQALNLQSGKNVYVLLKAASFDRPGA